MRLKKYVLTFILVVIATLLVILSGCCENYQGTWVQYIGQPSSFSTLSTLSINCDKTWQMVHKTSINGPKFGESQPGPDYTYMGHWEKLGENGIKLKVESGSSSPSYFDIVLEYQPSIPRLIINNVNQAERCYYRTPEAYIANTQPSGYPR